MDFAILGLLNIVQISLFIAELPLIHSRLRNFFIAQEKDHTIKV